MVFYFIVIVQQLLYVFAYLIFLAFLYFSDRSFTLFVLENEIIVCSGL